MAHGAAGGNFTLPWMGEEFQNLMFNVRGVCRVSRLNKYYALVERHKAMEIMDLLIDC